MRGRYAFFLCRARVDSLVAGGSAANSVNTYTHDGRSRLVQGVSSLGTSGYQVNALGQRIRKASPLGDTIYHYDAQGRLIAESTAGGTIRREYVYLGEAPVAVLE